MVGAMPSGSGFGCTAARYRCCIPCAVVSERSDAPAIGAGILAFSNGETAKMAGIPIYPVFPALGSAWIFTALGGFFRNFTSRFRQSDGGGAHHRHMPVHLLSGIKGYGKVRISGIGAAAPLARSTGHRRLQPCGCHKTCAAGRRIPEGRILLPVHRR